MKKIISSSVILKTISSSLILLSLTLFSGCSSGTKATCPNGGTDCHKSTTEVKPKVSLYEADRDDDEGTITKTIEAKLNKAASKDITVTISIYKDSTPPATLSNNKVLTIKKGSKNSTGIVTVEVNESDVYLKGTINDAELATKPAILTINDEDEDAEEEEDEDEDEDDDDDDQTNKKIEINPSANYSPDVDTDKRLLILAENSDHIGDEDSDSSFEFKIKFDKPVDLSSREQILLDNAASSGPPLFVLKELPSGKDFECVDPDSSESCKEYRFQVQFKSTTSPTNISNTNNIVRLSIPPYSLIQKGEFNSGYGLDVRLVKNPATDKTKVSHDINTLFDPLLTTERLLYTTEISQPIVFKNEGDRQTIDFSIHLGDKYVHLEPEALKISKTTGDNIELKDDTPNLSPVSDYCIEHLKKKYCNRYTASLEIEKTGSNTIPPTFSMKLIGSKLATRSGFSYTGDIPESLGILTPKSSSAAAGSIASPGPLVLVKAVETNKSPNSIIDSEDTKLTLRLNKALDVPYDNASNYFQVTTFLSHTSPACYDDDSYEHTNAQDTTSLPIAFATNVTSDTTTTTARLCLHDNKSAHCKLVLDSTKRSISGDLSDLSSNNNWISNNNLPDGEIAPTTLFLCVRTFRQVSETSGERKSYKAIVYNRNITTNDATVSCDDDRVANATKICNQEPSLTSATLVRTKEAQTFFRIKFSEKISGFTLNNYKLKPINKTEWKLVSIVPTHGNKNKPSDDFIVGMEITQSGSEKPLTDATIVNKGGTKKAFDLHGSPFDQEINLSEELKLAIGTNDERLHEKIKAYITSEQSYGQRINSDTKIHIHFSKSVAGVSESNLEQIFKLSCDSIDCPADSFELDNFEEESAKYWTADIKSLGSSDYQGEVSVKVKADEKLRTPNFPPLKVTGFPEDGFKLNYDNESVGLYQYAELTYNSTRKDTTVTFSLNKDTIKGFSEKDLKIVTEEDSANAAFRYTILNLKEETCSTCDGHSKWSFTIETTPCSSDDQEEHKLIISQRSIEDDLGNENKDEIVIKNFHSGDGDFKIKSCPSS